MAARSSGSSGRRDALLDGPRPAPSSSTTGSEPAPARPRRHGPDRRRPQLVARRGRPRLGPGSRAVAGLGRRRRGGAARRQHGRQAGPGERGGGLSVGRRPTLAGAVRAAGRRQPTPTPSTTRPQSPAAVRRSAARRRVRAGARAADVLLVNELPGLTEMSVPSKLTTYYATGLPVLAAVGAGSTTAAEIGLSGGGRVVPAGDPAALLSAAEALGSDPDQAAALGAAGRHFRVVTSPRRPPSTPRADAEQGGREPDRLPPPRSVVRRSGSPVLEVLDEGVVTAGRGRCPSRWRRPDERGGHRRPAAGW